MSETFTALPYGYWNVYLDEDSGTNLYEACPGVISDEYGHYYADIELERVDMTSNYRMTIFNLGDPSQFQNVG